MTAARRPRAKHRAKAAPRPLTWRWDVVLALAFALGCFSLGVIDVFHGWDHDGGNPMLWSSWIAQGRKPYIDIPTIYTPAFFMLNAIPMALGLSPDVGFFLLPIAWLALNGVATYLAVHEWTKDSRIALVLAGLCYPFMIENGGMTLMIELGVTFFSLLTLWLLKKDGGRKYDFWAGVCASLAFLCKQVGVITLIPAVLIVFAYRDRRGVRNAIAPFAAGYLAPCLLILAWLHFDIVAIRDRFLKLFDEYARLVPPGQGEGFWNVIDRELWRGPFNLATTFGAMLLAALTVLAPGKARPKLAALGLAAALVAYFAPRFNRNYYHYSINCWPYIAVLLALPLPKLFPESWRKRWWLVPAALLVTAGIQGYRHEEDLRWSAYFSRWSYGTLDKIFIRVGQKIRQLVPPGTPIVIIGDEPVLAYLSGTEPVGGSLFFNLGFDHYKDQFAPIVVLEGYIGTWDNVTAKRAQLQQRGYVQVPHDALNTRSTLEIWVDPRQVPVPRT